MASDARAACLQKEKAARIFSRTHHPACVAFVRDILAIAFALRDWERELTRFASAKADDRRSYQSCCPRLIIPGESKRTETWHGSARRRLTGLNPLAEDGCKLQTQLMHASRCEWCCDPPDSSEAIPISEAN